MRLLGPDLEISPWHMIQACYQTSRLMVITCVTTIDISKSNNYIPRKGSNANNQSGDNRTQKYVTEIVYKTNFYQSKDK